MVNWFLDLFILENLGYFILGVATACAWHVVKARLQHRVVVIKWNYLTFPLVAIVAVYMAAQNQQNANCTREFNQAIREARKISSENDALSIEHRALLSKKGRLETQMWVKVIRPPDQTLADLDFNDPRREHYGRVLIDQYTRDATEIDGYIVDIEERQRVLLASRPPLPPPTCGQ